MANTDTKKVSNKTVSVWLDPETYEDGSPKQKFFRCFNCGTIITEYSGEAKRIIPGGTPFHPGTTFLCKGTIFRNRKDNSQSAYDILMSLGIQVDDASFKDLSDERFKNKDGYYEQCGIKYRFYWIDTATEKVDI